MTWDERSERPTWMARHSLVYSSTTVRRRTAFAVTGTKSHKVVCPDVVPSLRPQPHAGAVSKPESTPLGLFGSHFESFPPPDPLHPLVLHSPSIPLQHGTSPAGTQTVRTGWLAEGPPLSGPTRRQPLFQRTSVLTGVALAPGKRAAQRCHTCPVPTPRISAGEPGSEVSPCCLL